MVSNENHICSMMYFTTTVGPNTSKEFLSVNEMSCICVLTSLYFIAILCDSMAAQYFLITE